MTIVRFERRQEPRSRTILGARAVFNERFSTMDCRVRDISANGARLRFGGPPLVPTWFELLLVERGERIRARRVWTNGNDMGVVFVRDAA
ncbi:PilZ domain-containing protein [Pinisolibacter sp.]|uniref:PilZ domain-containing protein n=1 Tax=Pinisolibacter sp. TaxID=2172024 RepID=UPI002FDE1803